MDILIAHPRKHGKRQDSLVGRFGYRCDAGFGAVLFPVERMQVNRNVMHVDPNALCTKRIENRPAIDTQLVQIELNDIQVVAMLDVLTNRQRRYGFYPRKSGVVLLGDGPPRLGPLVQAV